MRFRRFPRLLPWVAASALTGCGLGVSLDEYTSGIDDSWLDGGDDDASGDASVDGRDGAAGDASPGEGGTTCGAPGTFTCAGAAQRGVLACNDGTWQPYLDCSGTQLCDSSLGPAVSERCAEPVAACVGQKPGAYLCDGSKLLRCGPDLVTVTSTDCGSPQSCASHVEGECGACADGEYRCAGPAQASVLACQSGTWQPHLDCPSGELCDSTRDATVADRCADPVPACAGKEPGAYVCDGAKLTQCGPDLVTSTSTECGSPELCGLHADGQCAVCEDGQTQCNGAEVQQCAADHLSFTTTKTCNAPPDPVCQQSVGTCKEDGTCGYPDKPSGSTPCAAFVKLEEVCKLIVSNGQAAPTTNDTHHKFNLGGTGLGIPVAHGNDLYLFFGDSAGYKGIWKPGESLPDAVGYSGASASSVATTPSLLCNNLKILTVAGSTVGHDNDATIQADFAGAAMGPEALWAEYIHNPAGSGKYIFEWLPGTNEVPTGAFSYGGSIYLFYTTVQTPTATEPKGSYLVKWSTPTTSGTPDYTILYGVDQRFDATGALGGNFVNVSPVVVGTYVYLYGTGKFRDSPVHLARKALGTLATAGGFEVYDPTTKTWGTGMADPIVDNAKLGELSVRYFSSISRYVMMAQETTATGNFIMVRFASAPEGPFSAPVAVAQMEDPAFRSTYCCSGADCSGQRLFNCDKYASFYGTYMLPTPIVNGDGSFTIPFTMSTMDPYNVALMQATFK